MHIIKLNATDSTNSYLRRLSLSEELEDFTVVRADYQSEGRGQMGTSWQSQASKNLMVSVFKRIECLQVERQFLVSMCVSLAVKEVLSHYLLKQVKIKWPNDILSENKKIAGILIETIIKNNQLKSAIVGVGLNVNQIEFNELPKASSFQSLTGRWFDLDEVLNLLLVHLEDFFKLLEQKKFHEIERAYIKSLFRKDKPSTFESAKGEAFTGYIKGVTSTGQLQVLVEDGIVEQFDMKQVSLIY